jgi:hypothetical protein
LDTVRVVEVLMPDNKDSGQPRKVVGFRRTKLADTHLEGPQEPIYEGDELERPRVGRKLVGWRPTKIEGTELAGPSIPIFEDEEPAGEEAAPRG